MLLSSMLALALLSADPAPAAAASPPPAAGTSQASATAEDTFPIGAPHDDYEFVSWCYGALSGHMNLYKVVKPDLDKISTNPKEDAVLDAEQMKAGNEYLALYKRAMEAAEKASPQPINVRGAQALKTGANIWTPALQADPKTRMWSYLSWELPGRCETTAEKLYERSLLAAQALGVTIPDAPATTTADASTTAAPAPAKAAPAAAKPPLRGLQ